MGCGILLGVFEGMFSFPPLSRRSYVLLIIQRVTKSDLQVSVSSSTAPSPNLFLKCKVRLLPSTLPCSTAAGRAVDD